jgi:hypothetical protein
VCFDYRGETEITVFYTRPGETITDLSSGSGDGNETNSTRTRTLQTTGSEQITTSESDVLAEITLPRSLAYNLTVSPVGSGPLLRVEYITGFQERLNANFRVSSFDFICINARDKVCAVTYRLSESGGSGVNEEAVYQSTTAGTGFFSVPNYSGQQTFTRRLEVFVRGQKVNSEEFFSSQTVDSGTTVTQRVWGVPEYLEGSGSGQYSNTEIFDNAQTLIDQSYTTPELIDFGGVEQSGKIAVSLAYEEDGEERIYQYIEGLGDPVSTIFGKQAGDPYVMHRLSLV